MRWELEEHWKKSVPGWHCLSLMLQGLIGLWISVCLVWHLTKDQKIDCKQFPLAKMQHMDSCYKHFPVKWKYSSITAVPNIQMQECGPYFVYRSEVQGMTLAFLKWIFWILWANAGVITKIQNCPLQPQFIIWLIIQHHDVIFCSSLSFAMNAEVQVTVQHVHCCWAIYVFTWNIN